MTLVLDGPAIGLKALSQIYEEFFFKAQREIHCFVQVIKYIVTAKASKVPKDEHQELIEYKRRGYLFIIEQSTSKKRAGRQMRDLSNHFKLKGISTLNKLSAEEIIEYEQHITN